MVMRSSTRSPWTHAISVVLVQRVFQAEQHDHGLRLEGDYELPDD